MVRKSESTEYMICKHKHTRTHAHTLAHPHKRTHTNAHTMNTACTEARLLSIFNQAISLNAIVGPAKQTVENN